MRFQNLKFNNKKKRECVGIEPTYRNFGYDTTDLKSAEPTRRPCIPMLWYNRSITDINCHLIDLYEWTKIIFFFIIIKFFLFNMVNTTCSGDFSRLKYQTTKVVTINWLLLQPREFLPLRVVFDNKKKNV